MCASFVDLLLHDTDTGDLRREEYSRGHRVIVHGHLVVGIEHVATDSPISATSKATSNPEPVPMTIRSNVFMLDSSH